MSQEPKVGTAILVTRENRVLLMKRKGPHGAGTWSPPGGHMDFGETPEGCAVREAREEMGLELVEVHFRAVTNDVFEESGKHYITLWMEAGSFSGEPVIASEQEVEQIGWFAWDSLPQPLFLPLENFVKGKTYPPG
jgi:8-oxo-dGTP diphosphatase